MSLILRTAAGLLATSLALVASAQPLAVWDFETGRAGATIDPGVAAGAATVVDLLGAARLTASNSGRKALRTFGAPTTTTANGYYDLEVICPGGDCSITGVALSFERSATGPTQVEVRYSLDEFQTSETSLGVFPVPAGQSTTLSLPFALLDVTDLNVRVYPLSSGSDRLPSASFFLDDFVVNGSVSAPVPVTFVSVALKRGALEWSVAQEVDVREYRVEALASEDTPADVTAVATVPATGAGASTNATFTYHTELNAAVAYVRVVAVDLDGSLTTTDWLATGAATSPTTWRVLAPERGRLTVDFSGADGPDSRPSFLLADALGRPVARFPGGADGRTGVDVSALAAGVYLVSDGYRAQRVYVP